MSGVPESWFLFRVLTAQWRKKWIAERTEEVVFPFLGSGYYMSDIEGAPAGEKLVAEAICEWPWGGEAVHNLAWDLGLSYLRNLGRHISQ